MASCLKMAFLWILLHSVIQMSFTSAVDFMSVPCDAPVGYLVARLDCRRRRFEFESAMESVRSLFALDDGGCGLVTAASLVSAVGQEFSVALRSADRRRRRRFPVFRIKIEDPANGISFRHRLYRGCVLEDSRSGTGVRGLRTTAYRFPSGDARAFSGEPKLKMHTTRPLDRERREKYNTAEVVVKDTDDNPPVMRLLRYVAIVGTDLPVSSVILRASARDPDPTSKITYHLRADRPDLPFSIDPNSGDIYLATTAPMSPGLVNFSVFAKDSAGRQSEPSKVQIHVESPYRQPAVRRHRRATPEVFPVPEDNTGQLFTLKKSPNFTEKFYLVSDPVHLFEVSPSNGTVSLQKGKTLDYEDTNQQHINLKFNISWQAGGTISSRIADVIVQVTDVDESPYFINQPRPFLANVLTSTQDGAVIFELKGKDPDIGHRIIYEMNPSGQFFSIQRETGVIRLVNKAGLKYNKTYSMLVRVTDIDSNLDQSTEETLLILYGERPPQFYNSTYSGYVLENNQVDQIVGGLTIAVKSFQNRNIKFSLSRLDGTTPSEFTIFSISGHDAEAQIKVMKIFDYEMDRIHKYQLIVHAIDPGSGGSSQLTSTASLVIDIRDVNDNRPKFSLSTYVIKNILENIAVGSEILSVTANDADSGINAELVYSVDDDHFDVTTVSRSGKITVKKELDYDLSENHMYQFNITVTDKGAIPMKGQATVMVYLTNVNDNAPVFLGNTSARVREDARTGTVVKIIQAVDQDGDNIVYYLKGNKTVDGPFEIVAETGLIRLRQPLPQDLPYYLLDVIAIDDGSCCGHKVKRSSNKTFKVEIIDINNNKPVYVNCSSYSSSIKENMPVGTFIVKVLAEDHDRGRNGEVEYSIIVSDKNKDDNFEVGTISGNVTSKVVFDRENEDNIRAYSVIVKASDLGTPQLEELCTFKVTILDVNDNKPVFDTSPYTASLSKGKPVGSDVVTVRARDKDVGDNAKISYVIVSNPGTYFIIDSAYGIIKLNRSLIKYDGNNLTITVVAKDHGEESLNTTVNVKFEIVEASFKPPEWTSQVTEFNVSENQKKSEPFATLTAKSNVPENPMVSFFLMDGTNPKQQVSPFEIVQTGNEMKLQLFDTLDYEKTKAYNVRARVTNLAQRPLYTELRIKINVLDYNDNRPYFEGLEKSTGYYKGQISENQNISTSVMQLLVNDLDTVPAFRTVRFSIKENSTDATKFSINKRDGTIRTNQVFDREKQDYYYIIIQATDNPGGQPQQSNDATVHVTILDLNDNTPYFQNSSYVTNVNEDAEAGTTILRVTANDLDTSGDLEYSITGGNDEKIFAVQARTGEIYLASGNKLDYEEKARHYTLNYSVSDGLHQNTTQVEISVIDVNDNAPVFSNDTYLVENIQEEDPSIAINNPKFLIKVKATDPDIARKNDITYSISGSQAGSFRINPHTGVIHLVKKLDRDPGTGGRPIYEFNVLAEDEPNSSNVLVGYATVKIKLLDINDNDPAFEITNLKGEVFENSPVDTLVMTVVAKDPDYGNNGTVQYEIQQNVLGAKQKRIFKIHNSTGAITVNSAELDREIRDNYDIIVLASDKGIPIRSSTANVKIIIKDVNDNAPVFSNKLYSVKISENRPKGHHILTLVASDRDIGKNQKLTYRLASGSEGSAFFFVRTFKPSNFGWLELGSKVDYEKPDQRSFNLTVVVQDSNITHTDVAYVYVTVTDFNDNKPKFDPLKIVKKIDENVKPGTFLGNFTVQDLDSGVNGDFEFSVSRKSDLLRQFKVKKIPLLGGKAVGEVSVNKELDREAINNYTLEVLAIDKGVPQTTGTGIVEIKLNDINDNYPIFLKDYRPVVMEDTGPISTVITVEAKDLDLATNGPPFKFWLPCECPCTAYLLCNDFGMEFIGSAQGGGNGKGIISSKRIFDREKKKFYYMPIVMQDSGSPRLSGTNTLTIEIGDINDNKHGPGHKDILVYNYKGLFGNISLGTVYCEDPDDWDFPDKTFTFIGPENIQEYFTVRLDGKIIMAKGVPEGVFNFKASVHDKTFGNTETCTVTITVMEVSEEAVYRSGSVRLEGISAESFVKQNLSTKPPGKSAYNKFQGLLAQKLGIAEEDVFIFSVMENKKGFTDVRYSAHSSPWYPPSRTNAVIEKNKKDFESVAGVKISMVNIDECLKETCIESGCTNKLVVEDKPALVNANGSSLVGVTAYVVAECTCGARTFSSKVQCTPGYCNNGGSCEQDDWKVVKCTCPEGFPGPRCQQRRLGFKGEGYALFSPLEQCEDSRTSLEFITLQKNGLLLYNGPVTERSKDEEKDFIALELNLGYPQLIIDHGSGLLTLTINGHDKHGNQTMRELNDGSWHRIDIVRRGKNVRLIVDHCKHAVITARVEEDRTPCEAVGSTPGENLFINVNTMLQLGGRYMKNLPKYPPISRNPYKGCIKNLMHNGQLYDLHIPRDNIYSKNVQNGCPDEDGACGVRNSDSYKCGVNGTCVGNIKVNSHKCICKPGYRGSKCDIATTVKDFKEDSFIEWELKNEFYADLEAWENEIQLMFRTRDSDGFLFRAPGVKSTTHMTLQVLKGHPCVSYNLNFNPKRMCLDHAEASDGQWHVLKVKRAGSEVFLTMDGGEGRYYNDTIGSDGDFVGFMIKRHQLFAGANVTYIASSTSAPQPTIDPQSSDLQNSCMNDIRYNDKWFPMIDQQKKSDAARVVKNRNIQDKCIRTDCQGKPCLAPSLCVPLWGLHECRCPPGYVKVSPPKICEDINECASSPCFGKAVCENLEGSFKCICPSGWKGKLCNTIGEKHVADSAGISTGALVAIMISFFIMIILVLVVILFTRSQKPADKYILEVDPDDDIRENVINYDEEGAGEEDRLAFDISRLRKPENELMREPPLKISPPESVKPLGSLSPRGEHTPDVGDYITDRIKVADDDPSAPPHDSVRDYMYEGAGSDAGSLSSLNTSTSSGDQDYDYLNDWGPKFAKLADMYGAGQAADED